jgi:hypothetical protein
LFILAQKKLDGFPVQRSISTENFRYLDFGVIGDVAKFFDCIDVFGDDLTQNNDETHQGFPTADQYKWGGRQHPRECTCP